MKVMIAVSAFVASAALGLGLASSQMLSTAPLLAQAQAREPTAPAPAFPFNPFAFLNFTPAPATPPASPPAAAPARTPAAAAMAPSPTVAAPAAPPQAKADVPAGMPVSDVVVRAPAAFSSAQVDGPYIALTFDDGPNPETTPKLLKMLEARNIKATFFVLGSKAVANPDVLKSIVAAGHEVGNHSWNHPQLPKLSVAAVDKQIEDTSAVIQSATGSSPKYLRPPYGAMTPSLQNHIEQKYGMSLIYWSVDPLDWKVRDPQAIYDQILKHVRPGAVVLAHDIHATTVAAMPRVLDALIAKGYKFVTVSELIARDKPGAPKVVAALPPPPRKKPKPAPQPGATATPVATSISAPAMGRPAVGTGSF